MIRLDSHPPLSNLPSLKMLFVITSLITSFLASVHIFRKFALPPDAHKANVFSTEGFSLSEGFSQMAEGSGLLFCVEEINGYLTPVLIGDTVTTPKLIIFL